MKSEKGKKIITILLIAFFLLGSFYFYYRNLQTDLYIDGISNAIKYLRWFIFLGLITLVICLLSFKFITQNKEKIHKSYFIIAMLLGTCYLFLMPLFTQSDEPAHYLRAYELSNGYFTTPYYDEGHGNYFDQSIIDSIYNNDKQREYKTYEDMLDISKIQVNKEDKEFLSISASNYSIINYIPHTIGILIGKLFRLNPYFCGLTGRFFSLLFCVSLGALGIKLLPEGKFFAFTLLLSPVFLSYSASFSADGTTIAYTFLFISYILSKIKKKELLHWKDYLVLSILTICTSVAKIVYLPLILLIILLPKECFKNKKQEIILKIVLIGLGFIANFGWQFLLRSAATVATSNNSVSETNLWIFKEPIRYAMVIFNTIANNGYNELENIFAGEFLCHWQVRPYALVNFGFILVNLFAFLSEEKNKDAKTINTLLVLFTGVVIYGLVCTAMYQASTYEGARIVDGIQGRYFFPIICSLLFLKIKNPVKLNKNYLTYVNIILNFWIMLEMIHVFVY